MFFSMLYMHDVSHVLVCVQAAVIWLHGLPGSLWALHWGDCYTLCVSLLLWDCGVVLWCSELGPWCDF